MGVRHFVRNFLVRERFLAAGLLMLALGLTGCSDSLQEWARISRPKFGIPETFEGQSSLKISPGTTQAVSSDGQVSAKVHVTITDRPLSSSDVSARVSISRTRTEGAVE